MMKRRIPINEPGDKTIYDYAQGITSKIWYKMHMSRKEGQRGDCADVLIKGVKENIKKSNERLMSATTNTAGDIRTNRNN